MLNPQEGLHVAKLSKNNLLTWTQKPTEKKIDLDIVGKLAWSIP